MMLKNTSNRLNFTFNCNGKLFYADQPVVMGIINITPDSFYAGSCVQETAAIVQTAMQMVADGARIIDIGAQSTRPGSHLLSWEEEWSRLADPLQQLVKALPDTVLSVDSFYSKVAEYAVSSGAGMINDISGGNMDAEMLTVAGQLNVPYICMHMQGTPQNMQENPSYTDLVQQVLDFFIERKFACEAAGIKDIILDPGFGFGKTIAHNYSLLKNLSVFTNILELPILAGLSRKSMIYKTLDSTPENSLNGTTALNMIALQNGASILRVHDVKEAVEAVQLWQQLQQA